jgi:hypothetical protein
MKWKFILSVIILSVIVIFLIIFISQTLFTCKRPVPIPKEKMVFIGQWYSASGFHMEIKPSGIVNVDEIRDLKNPDFDKLSIGVTDEYAKNMLVSFEGDTVITITQPTVRGRSFRINTYPYMDNDTCKMIMNEVLLIKQK